jgi:hypothetical protein
MSAQTCLVLDDHANMILLPFEGPNGHNYTGLVSHFVHL